MVKNIIFEDRNNDWEIWEKNSSIERSIKRLKINYQKWRRLSNYQKS